MQKEFNKNEAVKNMTDNLRVLRNKLNLTQDELARKIGISRQTIADIENKKRILPLHLTNTLSNITFCKAVL